MKAHTRIGESLRLDPAMHPTQSLLGDEKKRLYSNLLGNYLQDWGRLKECIDSFSPTVIIYLARKMPRIAEVLRWEFPNALVVSDFALPWLRVKLQGERVAIVDDIVRKGTTIEHVKKRVNACNPLEIQSFAVARCAIADASAEPENSGAPSDTSAVICSAQSRLTGSSYSNFTHNHAKALWLLSKSYEIEFPVFVMNYAQDSLEGWEILRQLKECFGDEAVHSTISGEDFDDTGLLRCSIDLLPERSLNYKFRVYFDDEHHRAVLVPMASHHSELSWECCRELDEKLKALFSNVPDELETFQEETAARAKQFVASLDFGLTVLSTMRGFFVPIPDAPLIDLCDASMLFGSDIASELAEITLPTEPTKFCAPSNSEDLERQDSSDFWITAERLTLLDEVETRSRPFKSRTLIFIAFFDVLAEWVGELDPTTSKFTDSDFVENLHRDPYTRLRRGPTFGELLSIFGQLWDMTDTRKLRHAVSNCLDHCIDRGSVVPVFNSQQKRIFRKGEAPLYDSNLLIAQRLLCQRNGRQVSIEGWQTLTVKWTEAELAELQAALAYLDQC